MSSTIDGPEQDPAPRFSVQPHPNLPMSWQVICDRDGQNYAEFQDPFMSTGLAEDTFGTEAEAQECADYWNEASAALWPMRRTAPRD